MKLEPDLIKEILGWCEETLPDDEKGWLVSDLELKKYSPKQINFHVKLLCENGYIDYSDSSSARGFSCFLNHLTMDGYQYLNLLRSKAWNTAKKITHEFGVIFAEGAIKAIIEKYQGNLLS
jgi:hypothetical protein